MDAQKRLKIIKIAAIVVAILILNGIVKAIMKSRTPVPALPAVVVQQPIWKKSAEYVTQTGTMVAYNAVNLVARVEGYLDAVEFTDGTFVKKGKPLFIIEPEPYLEKLKAAEATVDAQKAIYAYDIAEYARQKRMYKQQATSLNNVEKWAAKVAETKAEIDKAVADAQIAAINNSYTHVSAPFDGRIGRHLVDPGNLVGNGVATPLATIEQIDPIYVYFNLSELDLIKIRAAARAHGFKPEDINKVPVFVGMQNETGFPHEGRLNFVNTGLNASTGTMEFRALLSNHDYGLLPGFFVQVRISISSPTQRLTIPDTAVQYDQIGSYVLVVDAKQQVVLKRVEIGQLEQTARVILKGLDAHDQVIVSGLQNATPGHLVAPIQSGNIAS